MLQIIIPRFGRDPGLLSVSSGASHALQCGEIIRQIEQTWGDSNGVLICDLSNIFLQENLQVQV